MKIFQVTVEVNLMVENVMQIKSGITTSVNMSIKI